MNKKSIKKTGVIFSLILIFALGVSSIALAEDSGDPSESAVLTLAENENNSVGAPNLYGYTEGEAIALIQGMNLDYACVYQEDDANVGRVISQSPESGTIVDFGTVIQITIGKASETTTEETTEESSSTEETTTEVPSSTEETTTEETTKEPSSTEETTTEETSETEEDSSEETSSIDETTPDETSSQKETTSEKATSEKATSEKATSEKEKSEKNTKKTETTKEDKDNKETETTTAENDNGPGLDKYEDVGVVVNDRPEKYGTLYWPLPAEYGVNAISSRYGYRTGEYSGMHRGLDIAAPTGTPIYACADGTVIASYFSDSAGNFTIIQHEDGIYTEYMHQSVRHVKAGDKVKAGQLIGLVGSTGWSTGPHLHIGVVLSDNGYDSSKRVDPLPYLTTDTSVQSKTGALKDVKEEDLKIEYKDGTKFTNKVNERKDLTKSLYPLVSSSSVKNTSFSGFKYKGYLGSEGDKLKTKNAVTAKVDPGFNKLEDTWVKYETGSYDIVFTIAATYNSTKKEIPLSARLDTMAMNMDWSACRNADLSEPFFEEVGEDEGAYFAFAVHVDVYEHGTDKRINEREVYQLIKDIDEGQTFRCINEKYDASRLFTESTKKFNKNNNDNDHNVYITANGDIYSDYSLKPYSEFESSSTSNAYRQTSKLAEEGLDLVFGFEHKAEVNVNFYVPKRTVMFKATEGGQCDVIGEVVSKRGSITGIPEVKADEGYEFKGWITDQDVELASGGVVKKGNTITPEQIKDVTVMNRLTFTAVFEQTKSEN